MFACVVRAGAIVGTHINKHTDKQTNTNTHTHMRTNVRRDTLRHTHTRTHTHTCTNTQKPPPPPHPPPTPAHRGDTHLVDLHAVDNHAAGCVQLPVADVALEVLGLLVLDENLLIIELAIAIPVGLDKGKKKRRRGELSKRGVRNGSLCVLFVAIDVLGLLVLDENLLIVELAIAIPVGLESE